MGGGGCTTTNRSSKAKEVAMVFPHFIAQGPEQHVLSDSDHVVDVQRHLSK